MAEELFDELMLEDLSPQWQKIVEIIGMKAYIELTKKFGGMTIIVPQVRTALEPVHTRRVKAEFTGKNEEELAKKYGISVTMVYRRVRAMKKEMRTERNKNQLNLFEEEKK